MRLWVGPTDSRHGPCGSAGLHGPGAAAERCLHGSGSENEAVFRTRFQAQKFEGAQCAFTLWVPKFGSENGRFFWGRFPAGPESGMRTGREAARKTARESSIGTSGTMHLPFNLWSERPTRLGDAFRHTKTVKRKMWYSTTPQTHRNTLQIEKF